MSPKRRNHSAQLKSSKIAMEAAKGEQTVSQLASYYNVHPTQIRKWKRQLLDDGP